MRLRAPNIPFPRWAERLLFGLFLVGMSPIILMASALLGLFWVKRKLLGPSNDWRGWFAWRPVETRTSAVNSLRREWRWLEVVERRSGGLMCDTRYRTVGSNWEEPTW